MNAEGCIAPMATDEMWIVAVDHHNGTTSPPPPCDVSIVGFAVWLGILSLLKIITGTGLSVDWYMRYRSREGRARLAKAAVLRPGTRPRDQVRYPVVPTLNLLQALLYSLLLVFGSTGTCSSRNGCALALYCSMFLMSAAYCVVLLKQFVALGKRMIPLARSKMMKGLAGTAEMSSSNNNTDSSGNGGADYLDPLGQEDAILRIMIVLQAVCGILQFVFGVIVQLVDRSQYGLWIRLAFAFQTGFFIFNMLGFLVQLQRLILATKIGCAKPYDVEVLKALSKMRQTQIGFTFMHIWSLTVALLVAVGVIQVQWFVTLLILTSDTAATTLTFVKFALGKLMKKPRHVKKQTVPVEEKKLNPTNDKDATQGTLLPSGRRSVLMMNGGSSTANPLSGRVGDVSLAAYTLDV